MGYTVTGKSFLQCTPKYPNTLPTPVRSGAENLFAPFFANSGRPSIPPGVSFWMLFIGYLEGSPLTEVVPKIWTSP